MRYNSLQNRLKKRGVFLVLEGADGTGKTTLSKILHTLCEHHGYDSVLVRNPGCTGIGEHIRSIVKTFTMDDITYSWLFLAGLRDVMLNVVKTAIEDEHKIVIMDRFLRSSWIYQHYYSQDVEHGETITEYNDRLYMYSNIVHRYITFQNSIIPDHEIILTAPNDVILNRIHSRIPQGDEDENITSFESNDAFISHINDLYYDSVINNIPKIAFGDVQTMDSQTDVYVMANDILWGLDGRPSKRGAVFERDD